MQSLWSRRLSGFCGNLEFLVLIIVGGYDLGRRSFYRHPCRARERVLEWHFKSYFCSITWWNCSIGSIHALLPEAKGRSSALVLESCACAPAMKFKSSNTAWFEVVIDASASVGMVKCFVKGATMSVLARFLKAPRHFSTPDKVWF